MGQKQKHSIQDPSRLKFCEGIRGLGFGTSDGYTKEQLERTSDVLNSGNGLLRNGAFFVGSDGEMRIVLLRENCGRNGTPTAPPINTAFDRVRGHSQ